MLKYFLFKIKNNPSLPLSLSVLFPTSIPLLSSSQLEATNACIGKVLTLNTTSCGKYN